MELTPRPRRRPWTTRAWTWLLVLVLAPVTLLVLVPTAVNLHRFVVAGDGLGVPYARGSVLLGRDVPIGDVEVGDVLTYSEDTAGRSADPSADLVTRRVAAIDDGAFEMSTDGVDGAPVERSDLDLSERATVCRAVLAVPLVGYPFLGLLDRTAVWLLLIGLGVGVGGLLALGRPRRREQARGGQHVRVGTRG